MDICEVPYVFLLKLSGCHRRRRGVSYHALHTEPAQLLFIAAHLVLVEPCEKSGSKLGMCVAQLLGDFILLL